MKSGLLALAAAGLLSSCTMSYPYLVATNDCNCEHFIHRDERGRFELELSARYKVSDRVVSTIELEFRNLSREPMSLRQAYVKGTSVNVRYQFNGQFQPMPYVIIPPGGKYTMTLQGSDTRMTDNPWLNIAGERIVIEIRGMLLGNSVIPPIVVTLVPYNPKLDS